MQEAVRGACSYAHAAHLLLRRAGIQAPAPRTAPSCLLPLQRHPCSPASRMGMEWVLMNVPQPLHVGVMGRCSSRRRALPSLPNRCKQGKLNKEKAEAAGHPACLRPRHFYISCCSALRHCAKVLLSKGSILPGNCFLNSTFEDYQSKQRTITPAS